MEQAINTANATLKMRAVVDGRNAEYLDDDIYLLSNVCMAKMNMCSLLPIALKIKECKFPEQLLKSISEVQNRLEKEKVYMENTHLTHWLLLSCLCEVA